MGSGAARQRPRRHRHRRQDLAAQPCAWAEGREPLHLVSAWAARQRLVQEAVDEKSNDIVAIPLLLERLKFAGALVTIDAMGTQTAIAEKIVARGGDYLLAFEANWPLLQKEVETFFADPPPHLLKEPFETTDNDHGRVERRRCLVCHDVGWLFSDLRFPGEPRFPHLSMIGMIETRVERNGTLSTERRYYLSSTPLDAKAFAAAARAHWGVENRLHWVLDVVFHDDLVRLRSGHGPQNMAVIRHMAMNLVRNPKDRHSLEVRRKLANLNPDYLEALIPQAPALT
jgi:predicted transposase YbfD/YdcC